MLEIYILRKGSSNYIQSMVNKRFSQNKKKKAM